MRPDRENAPGPGQGCQHVYKRKLLFEITGCIPVMIHHLYKFIVLILLLSILYRIYHRTYKHFWVFFLAIKKILGFYCSFI